MYQVKKKDGTLQDFDRSKVSSSVLKSGATNEEAEKVAAQVEAWLPTVAVNNAVEAMTIRTKVLEILKGVNPTASSNFENYKKGV